MLDKIGGNKYGVAKRVNPVIARASHSSAEAFLDTVRQITADYQQIYTQDPTHARAILNLSWGYPPNELGEGKDSWINEMRALLQGLISKGVTVIVPSGNKYANQVRRACSPSFSPFCNSSVSLSTVILNFLPEKVGITGSLSCSWWGVSMFTMANTDSFGNEVQRRITFKSMHQASQSTVPMAVGA